MKVKGHIAMSFEEELKVGAIEKMFNHFHIMDLSSDIKIEGKISENRKIDCIVSTL